MAETLTLRRNKAASFFFFSNARTKRPGKHLPKATEFALPQQFPTSEGDLFWTSAHSGHPAEAGSARITRQRAVPGSSESAGMAGGA